ncbi:hypothetical protein UFOVP98_40 [uncultured Caudovirales phage]|uniref:Uncharacterized protein n=1 Tax=uncultured Caudovirales phage TaxID=2100421 RepID=A0A6J5LLA2_9CAUD|nr:hypothetical protein UFOVP98_40 [uncultured Caudovirales phage]CAB4134272.1 hypothetical protein UFOVP269_30 [uncultured Caudovirales phage]
MGESSRYDTCHGDEPELEQERIIRNRLQRYKDENQEDEEEC